MKLNEERYIGDGVYVRYDGHYIWLRAPRENGDHEIGLEPALWAELQKFVGETWKMKESAK